MSEPNQEPLTVELAPLPREQIGPFLLLGLDKDAGPDEVQAHWSQRVTSARRNEDPTLRTDINWARDVLNDPERRIQADAASLNADVTDRLLNRLAEHFGVEAGKGPQWEPLDCERSTDEAVATSIPEPDQIRAQIVVPEVTSAAPAAATLLEQWVRQPLDPWAIEPFEDGSCQALARRASEGMEHTPGIALSDLPDSSG